jgi:dephospho-CoA kinase
MAQLTDQWMILVAGPIRSGKSTLAGHIVGRFGGVRVSFGDAVRRRVKALGLPDERRLLQQVGEEWVAHDPEGLCDAVLMPSAGEVMVVVDGVRHQHVQDLLRAQSQGRRVIMVFVHVNIHVRRDRLIMDGISDEIIDRVLSHSTEKELPLLREAAEIVVDGTMDTTPVLVALEALMADGENQNSC